MNIQVRGNAVWAVEAMVAVLLVTSGVVETRVTPPPLSPPHTRTPIVTAATAICSTTTR